VISLDEFNEAHRPHFNILQMAQTGIACPKCGEELYDSKPSEVILGKNDGDLPQKAVTCLKCKWKGTRNV
jgi:hypothetical protein